MRVHFNLLFLLIMTVTFLGCVTPRHAQKENDIGRTPESCGRDFGNLTTSADATPSKVFEVGVPGGKQLKLNIPKDMRTKVVTHQDTSIILRPRNHYYRLILTISVPEHGSPMNAKNVLATVASNGKSGSSNSEIMPFGKSNKKAAYICTRSKHSRPAEPLAGITGLIVKEGIYIVFRYDFVDLPQFENQHKALARMLADLVVK